MGAEGCRMQSSWITGKQRRNRKAGWETDKTWSAVMVEAWDSTGTDRSQQIQEQSYRSQ